MRELLARWGLTPALDVQGPPASRNATQLCRDRQGSLVLVKCTPRDDDGAQREATALSYLLVQAGGAHSALHVPRLWGSDLAAHAVALEWVSEAPTLYQHHRTQAQYEVPVFRRLGASLGTLHRATSVPDLPLKPRVELTEEFLRLRPDFYVRLSPAGLAFFSELQRDAPAMAKLHELAELEHAGVARTLVHGDARQANVLLRADGELVWLDWERAAPGDPARDVGHLLSEYAHQVLLPETAQEELSAALYRRSARAFFEAYRHVVAGAFDTSNDFLARVAGWAGVGLLAAVFSRALREGRYGPDAQALARRARDMVARPHEAGWLGGSP